MAYILAGMSTPGANSLVPASIPPFNASGVLPPYVGPDPAQIGGLAPYETTLTELVTRFATSPERKQILRGFMAHRQKLLGLGINGVQWLDGSFVEDLETSKQRSPRDIDVVTFFVRPPNLAAMQVWESFIASNEDVFRPQVAKSTYRTDPYYVDVSFGPLHVIEQTAYWSGLFSHQRETGLWKGLLKVWLDQQRDDANALQLLNAV